MENALLNTNFCTIKPSKCSIKNTSLIHCHISGTMTARARLIIRNLWWRRPAWIFWRNGSSFGITLKTSKWQETNIWSIFPNLHLQHGSQLEKNGTPTPRAKAHRKIIKQSVPSSTNLLSHQIFLNSWSNYSTLKTPIIITSTLASYHHSLHLQESSSLTSPLTANNICKYKHALSSIETHHGSPLVVTGHITPANAPTSHGDWWWGGGEALTFLETTGRPKVNGDRGISEFHTEWAAIDCIDDISLYSTSVILLHQIAEHIILHNASLIKHYCLF